MIVPGWYATDSVKWLDRIWFTAGEFDGVFQADDYRLRAPGEPGPGRRMTELPAHRSLAHGRHELACRAIDLAGNTQPDRVPANVRGYGNNAIHRVRFRAE